MKLPQQDFALQDFVSVENTKTPKATTDYKLTSHCPPWNLKYLQYVGYIHVERKIAELVSYIGFLSLCEKQKMSK